MAIIIPRRRGGTWEGVPMAICCIDWICRMRGGLVHHTIMIPAALSLPLLRGACRRSCTDNISKWLVLYKNLDFFQSRQFFRLLATRARKLKICRIVVSHDDGTKLELSSARCQQGVDCRTIRLNNLFVSALRNDSGNRIVFLSAKTWINSYW